MPSATVAAVRHSPQVLTQILNAYQPPTQPTSRAVLDALPRLRVRPAADAPSVPPGPSSPAQGAEAGSAAAEPDSAAVAAPQAGEAAAGRRAQAGGPTARKAWPEAPEPQEAGSAGAVAAPAGPEAGSTPGAEERYAACAPNEPCSVCHDALAPGTEVLQLPCQHCFHEECVMPWLAEVGDAALPHVTVTSLFTLHKRHPYR